MCIAAFPPQFLVSGLHIQVRTGYGQTRASGELPCSDALVFFKPKAFLLEKRRPIPGVRPW
jgi:hypothetical protein